MWARGMEEGQSEMVCKRQSQRVGINWAHRGLAFVNTIVEGGGWGGVRVTSCRSRQKISCYLYSQSLKTMKGV